MCISWRHAGDGNPINVANAQSAKQLRIYLTPSQAIKHFSFIHGRRDSNTFYHPETIYIYMYMYVCISTICSICPMPYPPGRAIDVVLFPAALQNNSHIWHASCPCFSPSACGVVPPVNVVIDGHANDETDIRVAGHRSSTISGNRMRSSCCRFLNNIATSTSIGGTRSNHMQKPITTIISSMGHCNFCLSPPPLNQPTLHKFPCILGGI